MCACIPIFVIHQLQLNRRTKVALCCVMGLGALTASCAIAKAVVLKEVFAKDYTWSITKPAICTVIEHLLGIIIASVPALKPLFSRLLNAASSSGQTSGQSNRRSFRKILSPEGSTPLQNTSLVNYVGGKGHQIPLDDKSITKTTEFCISAEQDLETADRLDAMPAWPIPDFPAPPTPAKERSKESMF